MNEFLGSLWWMVVTLGVLITFHEFGHFWVARRCGVKVTRFSIGFGKPLWSRFDRHGTEFAIAAIPLGGYVKMLDEREGDVAPSEVAHAHNRAPVWKRILISAAGPAANLLFAIAAFWLMFVIGKPDYQPVIDTPKGLAAEAGLEAGDRIVAIDGKPISAWTDAVLNLSEHAVARTDAGVDVDRKGATLSKRMAFSRIPDGVAEGELFDRIGLGLQPRQAVVGEVVAGSAAAEAGVKSGDRIVRINEQAVESYNALPKIVQEEAAKSPILKVAIVRDGQALDLELTARSTKGEDGKPAWRIGVGPRDTYDALLRYGPVAAIPAALAQTRETTLSSLHMLKLMVVGRAGLDNISGVITIARFANDSARLGVAWFLSFLGLISLSLAIMNLLPIPILDGGHIVYYLIELIKGSPVSERAQIAGQYVGLMLLVGLMGLAFYNDILRLGH